MTPKQLESLNIAILWGHPLETTFEKYNINTVLRKAAFIGQCSHESNYFKVLEENLRYSATSLMHVWPSRFPTAAVAGQYANDPVKIANTVYAGRMGNTEDGDGWKYHGRGLIQMTGKDNYINCGSALGLDLVNSPELLLIPENACLSAGWFWNKKGLNELADKQDYETMTKRINGGLLGLDDRKAKIKLAKMILG